MDSNLETADTVPFSRRLHKTRDRTRDENARRHICDEGTPNPYEHSSATRLFTTRSDVEEATQRSSLPKSL